MKCPGCAYESHDLLETCKHCGAPMVATSGAASSDLADDLRGLRFEPKHSAPAPWFPGRGRFRAHKGQQPDSGADFVEMLDDDALEVGEDDLVGVRVAGLRVQDEDGDPPFRLDDDFFSRLDLAPPALSDAAPAAESWPGHGDWAAAVDLPEPAFLFSEEQEHEPGSAAGAEPIVERCEDVPERFWAPEVAGLGRRSLALLVDQSLLVAVLAVFFLGTLVALRFNDRDTGLVYSADGLQASILPFALLAAGLSLAASVYFHGSTGRTPGKALAGIQVRSGDGGPLSWGQVLRRWLGAVLGLACAGVGSVWAIFEPRHRGWADLISGTVVVRTRQKSEVEAYRH